MQSSLRTIPMQRKNPSASKLLLAFLSLAGGVVFSVHGEAQTSSAQTSSRAESGGVFSNQPLDRSPAATGTGAVQHLAPSGNPLVTNSAPVTPSASEASATASAQPPSLGATKVDWAALSQTPGQWPKTVLMKEAVDFPAMLNGKVVGWIKVPRGSVAKVSAVHADGVTLDYQQTPHKVPVKVTDLEERVIAIQAAQAMQAAQIQAAQLTQTTPLTPTSQLTQPSQALPAPSIPASSSLPQAPTLGFAPNSTLVQAAAPDSMSNPRVSLERPTPERLQAALENAGQNRPELEKALAKSRDTGAMEMELLIALAPQIDLVNLTAQHLLNNVSYYQRVRREMPWASSIPEEYWLEYVLPYRVADEDLDDWKPEFYALLTPVVRQFRDTKTAARAVHQWLYRGGPGGKGRISFKVSDSRDQTPRQLLNQTKIGRCFEMNLLLVALLRSVGIPARHAGVAYWTNTEAYHYWVEYWDHESRKWLWLETAADPDKMMTLTHTFGVVYALPGFYAERDPIGRERWDMMTNVTATYAKTGKLEMDSAPATGVPVTYAVYNWASGAWRVAAGAQSTGKATFELAVNENQYPYLVSASVNGKMDWKWIRVTSEKMEPVVLRPGAAQEMVTEYREAKNDEK
jgi:hypothetical protein